MFKKIWSALKALARFVVDIFDPEAPAQQLRVAAMEDATIEEVERAKPGAFSRIVGYLVDAIAKAAPRIEDKLEHWSRVVGNRYARVAIAWFARLVRAWGTTRNDAADVRDTSVSIRAAA